MKILFSDYDGTLKIDGTISKENIEAIKYFQQQGHIFAIASGRGYKSLQAECQKYDLHPTYFVCNNGGAIFDQDGNILKIKLIDLDVVKQITNRLIEFGCVGYSYNDGILRAQETIDKQLSEQIMPCRHQDISCSKMLEKGSVAQIVGFIRGEEKCFQKAEQLQLEFNPYVECFANMQCLDVVPKGNSKANGIQFLIDKFALESENIYTIGDALNDVSMIEKFHGFALNHAVEEVLRTSEHQVPSVADCIKELL